MNYNSTLSSVLLVFVFLVSASGLCITRHVCLESGRVQVTFGGDYICCEGDLEVFCEEETTCCPATRFEFHSVEGLYEDCCVHDTRYIKTDKNYYSPGRTEISKTEIRIAFTFQYIELFPESTQTIRGSGYSPPGIIRSGEYLIQHSILLI